MRLPRPPDLAQIGRRADMLGMLDKPSFQARPCPICHKPSEAAYRPFCSKRCADIDLHRWLSGSYAVPAVERELGAPELMSECEHLV